MTPSRTLTRPAQPSTRRAGLLMGSALCGVAAMLGQPSLAQTLPGIPGAGAITVSTGGSQPAITAPNGNTLEIDLNAPRTVINWSSLHVSGADAMNFHFDANSDIVLNKTTSQILIDAGGTVTGKVGASTGGNIWFYSPQGVIVSPGATMTAGGFLFSRGTGMVDASFVDAGDPLANLRAATDALIRINNISSATSASIDSSGNVLLSASSGALNVGIAAGATVGLSTTSGSITASEVRATSGVASVTAGGPGATVTSITGATGVTVSSGANTSVGAATTTTSGDIVLTSNGSVSLTLGNSARDTLLTAPLIFLSTLDTARDAILTGATGVTVTNRIFAGDDIELTASNGDVSASGAFLRSTGAGASDDAHILLRSDTGAVTATNTLQTLGTGTQAGDITVQAATTASVGSATATRDLKVNGVTASLANGTAARDLFVTATTGDATVTVSATAGDDVEVTTTSGDILASGATLKSTGVGATDDAHVLVKSTDNAVNVGTAITQGTGVAAGDVTLDAGDTITAGSVDATRDVKVTAAGDVDLASATSGRDITVTSNGGQAIVRKAVLTGTGAGHDLSITADGNAVLGDPDYTAITTANVFSRTGGNTGTASVKSTGGGGAMAHLDTSATIDTVEGASVDVTISSGLASFGAITALTGNLYAETYDGGMTVGSATANNGTLDLYVAGGDLTITGSVHGGGATHLEADGLLDGTAATLISSDDDLTLIGGDVNVGELTAGLALQATAAAGDVVVQKAVAGQTVLVAAVDGDATLRAAEGPDGVTVVAMNTATFGADDKASITAANYAVTDASCGCGADGLQVLSYDGDVVVNINSASNGIAVVGASIGGDVTVVQKTGNLVIDELAAYNITLEAMAGTLDVNAISSGGDYKVTAQDFVGSALNPYLFSGENHDVTITDTLGDLDLGSAALHAGRKLTITAQDGAVKGLAQLDAGTGIGDGEISVTGQGVAVDTAEADYDVALDGGTGAVTVATSVTAGYNYHLTGSSFSTNALSPLGAQTGSWFIKVPAGYDFDFTGHDLHYVGGIGIEMVGGDVTGGVMTSDTGTVYLEGKNVRVATLNAVSGSVVVHGDFGEAVIGSATASGQITVLSNMGDAKLGSAVLTGTGNNTLLVRASNGGNVVLGATTPGGITTANIVTSAGASTIVEASTNSGKVDVNLDHTTNADLTTIDALNAVNIKVVNGSQRIIAARSITGAVRIDGPSGALLVDGLTAQANSQVNGGGDTRLASALVAGDLNVSSATGNLRFGDAVPGRVIDVSGALTLDAATDIAQQGVIKANSLGVTAGTGAVLLGANKVSYLSAVNVTTGGFAFHDTLSFAVEGQINALGQTVDLRSDHLIGQTSLGVIKAQKLTGSAVGGVNLGANNQVAELGDFTNTGGAFRLVDANALTITGTVLSTGSLNVSSHGGMTFASAGTVQANGAGDAVVLASDGVFTNSRGADAVTAANGRWLIYTQAVGNPYGSTAGNTFNGLAGKSFYGSLYGFSTQLFSVTPNAGNRFVYAYQPTLTVTPDSQIVTYNGVIPTTSATITGLLAGDLTADAWSGTAAISGATSKDVGTYTLTAGAGSLVSDLNYGFSYGTGALRIDPKALTAVLDADDKTYDRTTDATGTVVLGGVVLGDSVTAAGTYAFGDWNAGSGKTVTATGVALSGGDAGNYTLASVGAGSADILRKSLTGALTAGNKTYDGTTTATGTIDLTGVITGDVVSASGTYAFADKNAGTDKTVTVSSAALAGLDAANYDLGGVGGSLADILRRSVTVAADDQFKPFGRVDPPLTYRITVGSLVAGEAFTGGLIRDTGEVPGDYGITRGTLDLSTNYDLTFTGAVFTIDPLPSNAQDGSTAVKHVTQSPDFTLDWDPEPNLTTQGAACPGDGCPPQAAMSGGGKAVAALR